MTAQGGRRCPFRSTRSTDPSEKADTGVSGREWTALAQTEVGVVREMARCLREIGEGRW